LETPDTHEQEESDESSTRPRRRSFWAELPGLLLTALVIAVVIKTFLVQPFWIPSESMLPTIEVNDRVMVNKLAFNWDEPERGDIVVFRDPAEPHIEESIPEVVVRSVLEAVGIRTRGRDDLIKRVIGLPGEALCQGPIWVSMCPWLTRALSWSGWARCLSWGITASSVLTVGVLGLFPTTISSGAPS